MANTRDSPQVVKEKNPKMSDDKVRKRIPILPPRKKLVTKDGSGSSFSLGLSGPTVCIRVGPANREFIIHKSLLVQHSNYFKGCFRGTSGQFFTEGMTKVCRLEETDAAAFSYVNEWLYTKTIAQTGDVSLLDAVDEDTPDALMYIGIWKVADYLQMNTLMDFVMSRLNKAFNQHNKEATASDLLHLVLQCYTGTCENASPRVWISDLFALGLGDFEKTVSKDQLRDQTCPDFFIDVFFTRARMHDSLGIPPRTTYKKGYHFSVDRYLAMHNGRVTSTRAHYEQGRKERKLLKQAALPL